MDDAYVAARRVLLDALEALGEHAKNVIVIGAQAIYLRTGASDTALAPFTTDADLVVAPGDLADEPRLEEAMRQAGFRLDAAKRQPGAWLSAEGIPVDLMVPEALAGRGGRRSGRIPPHANNATRRALGLEAAIVDFAAMEVAGLGGDLRTRQANVAGTAALLVAKLHKLGEREGTPDRLFPKDAHDVYRLLSSADAASLGGRLRELLGSPLAAAATTEALRYLDVLFAVGPDALGSDMAGRAELGVGSPETVTQAAAFLARDVFTEVADLLE